MHILKKTGKSRSNAFMRFSMLFFAFFLILFLILVPLYIQTLALFTEKQISVNKAILDNGVERLEAQISQLSGIAYSFSQNNRYRGISLPGFEIRMDTVTTITGVQEDFSLLLLSQPAVNDSGIIYNNGFILTKQRNFIIANEPLNSFYGSFFSLKGYDTLELFFNSALVMEGNLLPGISSVTSFDYGIYDAIIWIFPVYGSWVSGYTNRGIFYVAMPLSFLLPSIASPEILEHGFITIRDRDGTEIVQHPKNARGDEYISYTSTGKQSGLSVTVSIPQSVFSSQLVPLRRTITFYTLIILGVGALLTVLFAYNSSKPIRKIADYFRHGENAASDTASRNEYQLIEQSILRMNRTLHENSDVIEQQRTIIRTNMIEKAIMGNIYLDSEIEKFRSLFPDFPEHYQMALFQNIESADVSPELSISRLFLLQEKLSEILPGYYLIQSVQSNLVLLLLPITEETDRWYHKLCDAKHALESGGLCTVQIVLSNTYSMIARLPTAYSELKYIMQFCTPENPNPVLRFNNAGNNRITPSIDFTHMRQLYEGLRGGEARVVRSVLLATQKNILENSIKNSLVKNEIYTCLRFVFERVQLELPGTLPELALPVMNDDILEMIKDFQQCGDQICNEINHGKPKTEDNLTADMLQFINDNYTDVNLYSKTITYRFAISMPTLQKVVQAATGKSFLEYVEEKRLTKANEMLSNTGLPAAQVASECGFSSYNSMYKAFKRKYNISPGALRSDG